MIDPAIRNNTPIKVLDIHQLKFLTYDWHEHDFIKMLSELKIVKRFERIQEFFKIFSYMSYENLFVYLYASHASFLNNR